MLSKTTYWTEKKDILKNILENNDYEKGEFSLWKEKFNISSQIEKNDWKYFMFYNTSRNIIITVLVLITSKAIWITWKPNTKVILHY